MKVIFEVGGIKDVGIAQDIIQAIVSSNRSLIEHIFFGDKTLNLRLSVEKDEDELEEDVRCELRI